jgi:hypothetical protein
VVVGGGVQGKVKSEKEIYERDRDANGINSPS